jgi:hypothetical protein
MRESGAASIHRCVNLAFPFFRSENAGSEDRNSLSA